MSIRFKVVLPYLFLTVVVAVIGVYVVTNLVSNTMRERLTNQLLEAGRVVSDNFVREEIKHVETARVIAYTTGLGDALAVDDAKTALDLAEPVFVGLGVENLILIAPDGKELVHLVLDENRKPLLVNGDTGAGQSQLVQPYLKERNVDAEPHRALGQNLANDEYYYFTSLPVSRDGNFAGVIVIGSTIRNILPLLKSTSLSDIIIYGGDGRAVATTLGMGDDATLNFISVTSAEYDQMIRVDDVVQGENFQLNGRWYSLARGPLQVGNDRIGLFAVALPLNFVVESGSTSRTTYVILFSAVMILVIAIGFGISRMIINPLSSLVRTSQAISGGNLDQRTGIHTKDEIGELAHTFDDMTERLQQHTTELERTNSILQKMDKTKGNFIQVSAHELRTPLTLVMGYSQMLQQKLKNDPELEKLTKGILDGSERMTEIVNSMLDVSRIDSNELKLKKTDLRIEQVVQKVKNSFVEAFESRHINFSMDGLNDLPLVSADPDMAQKVFHHLIMNAIKFTPDGGAVTVSGKYINGNEPPRVEIAVRDTGIGIEPDSHQLIFNKFYQTGDVMLHSSGKTKFKGGGPGLGLAIARGIVEAHGGQIWVESPGYNEQTNPGSAFFVSLPVEKKPEESS